MIRTVGKKGWNVDVRALLRAQILATSVGALDGDDGQTDTKTDGHLEKWPHRQNEAVGNTGAHTPYFRAGG